MLLVEVELMEKVVVILKVVMMRLEEAVSNRPTRWTVPFECTEVLAYRAPSPSRRLSSSPTPAAHFTASMDCSTSLKEEEEEVKVMRWFTSQKAIIIVSILEVITTTSAPARRCSSSWSASCRKRSPRRRAR